MMLADVIAEPAIVSFAPAIAVVVVVAVIAIVAIALFMRKK